MNNRYYIPTLKHWSDMYVKNFDKPYWMPQAKVPIDKIKIDRNKLAFDNVVSRSKVLDMLVNFHRECWEPIMVDKEYFLLDGQHRLEVAKLLGLNFIDVVVEDAELLEDHPQ
jgi:hypothetical protein